MPPCFVAEIERTVLAVEVVDECEAGRGSSQKAKIVRMEGVDRLGVSVERFSPASADCGAFS